MMTTHPQTLQHPSLCAPLRAVPAAATCVLLLMFASAMRAQSVLTLTPGRTAATAVGTGTAGYSGDNGAATAATLFNPAGAVYDASGNLYVSDARNNVVRKIAAGTGTITTVAGNGTQGYSGDGGAATSAALDQPMGLAFDASGNLYIADSHNHAIREVTGTTIATVAGTGAAGFSGDGGPATAATLTLPQGVAVDASGNVYIADTGNQRIRKVTGKTIATIAGTGNEAYAGDGGAATAASLDMPAGLALDASGNLYIADSHNQTVRKIAGTTISTVAGSGTAGFGGDGSTATAAKLALPQSVAVDSAGNVYIADASNNRVREVANGSIATIAGSGAEDFSGDTGLATAAAMDTPRSLAPDATGNLAVADTLNQRVRLIGLPVVSFGSQAVGSTSAAQTVTLGNSGFSPLPLTVSSLSLPSGFSVSGGSCSSVPIVLPSLTSCTIALVFKPKAAGTSSGTITASGSGLVPQTLLVTGIGTQGSTTTPTISFSIHEKHTVDAPFTAAATSNSAGAFTYSLVSGPATVTASGLVTLSGADGEVKIQATQAASGNYASGTTTASFLVAAGSVWAVNAGGSFGMLDLEGNAFSSTAFTGGGLGTVSTPGIIAFDHSGNAWIASGGGVSEFNLDGIPVSATAYTGGGISLPVALAVDGAGLVWIANSNSTISVLGNSGTAVSGSPGYPATSTGAPGGLTIDLSGNVWVANKTTGTITELIGAATPVSPVSTALQNGTIGGKP